MPFKNPLKTNNTRFLGLGNRDGATQEEMMIRLSILMFFSTCMWVPSTDPKIAKKLERFASFIAVADIKPVYVNRRPLAGMTLCARSTSLSTFLDALVEIDGEYFVAEFETSECASDERRCERFVAYKTMVFENFGIDIAGLALVDLCHDEPTHELVTFEKSEVRAAESSLRRILRVENAKRSKLMNRELEN